MVLDLGFVGYAAGALTGQSTWEADGGNPTLIISTLSAEDAAGNETDNGDDHGNLRELPGVLWAQGIELTGKLYMSSDADLGHGSVDVRLEIDGGSENLGFHVGIHGTSRTNVDLGVIGPDGALGPTLNMVMDKNVWVPWRLLTTPDGSGGLNMSFEMPTGTVRFTGTTAVDMSDTTKIHLSNGKVSGTGHRPGLAELVLKYHD